MAFIENLNAIILAAGQSKRFRSATTKVVHHFGGRPMIQWPLMALRGLGAERIVVVVGHDAESVKKCCDEGVLFAEQAERRGTGHAALMAKEILATVGGDTLILNADVPLLRPQTLLRLIETHRSTGGMLTVATAVVENPSGWGRILRRQGTVVGIIEERDATPEQRAINEVNVGLYCVNTSFLFPMLERITPENVQAEIYLTDLVGRAAAAGIYVADVQIEASEVAQINSRSELAEVEASLRTRINRYWMDSGVTMTDPSTVYIESDVRLGRDTILGPNVQLRGRTVIGERCRIDGTAVLSNATLGDDVHVKLGVVISDSTAAAECVIGPFAQLRPGTRLGRGVHIGDFVETKNAVLGAGTKANHLAYLGDTEIGSHTNVGAGTITCNYDGFQKLRTIIGNRVQIGSDTQLVAPVTIGDDAYIATGTTVREDVEDGALVYNQKPEIHRAGWVAQKRAAFTNPDAPVLKSISIKSPNRIAKPAEAKTTKKAPKQKKGQVRANPRTEVGAKKSARAVGKKATAAVTKKKRVATKKKPVKSTGNRRK